MEIVRNCAFWALRENLINFPTNLILLKFLFYASETLFKQIMRFKFD